jgi:hypothetical protein
VLVAEVEEVSQEPQETVELVAEEEEVHLLVTYYYPHFMYLMNFTLL